MSQTAECSVQLGGGVTIPEFIRTRVDQETLSSNCHRHLLLSRPQMNSMGPGSRQSNYLFHSYDRYASSLTTCGAPAPRREFREAATDRCPASHFAQRHNTVPEVMWVVRDGS